MLNRENSFPETRKELFSLFIFHILQFKRYFKPNLSVKQLILQIVETILKIDRIFWNKFPELETKLLPILESNKTVTFEAILFYWAEIYNLIHSSQGLSH